jgi:hypothetical protein
MYTPLRYKRRRSGTTATTYSATVGFTNTDGNYTLATTSTTKTWKIDPVNLVLNWQSHTNGVVDVSQKANGLQRDI